VRGAFHEDDLEEVVLGYFADLGYEAIHGPEIAPGGGRQERASFADVYLLDRLSRSLATINPDLDEAVLKEAIRVLRRAETQNLLLENERIHRLIREGVPVQVRLDDGNVRTRRVRLVDFSDPGTNDWLAVNQFIVVENGHQRRVDIVVFLNGLPVVIFELKSATDEYATLRGAWNQVQTYRGDIPSIFLANAVIVLSNGVLAHMGALTTEFDYYAPWRAIDVPEPADESIPPVKVLVAGALHKSRFLDLLENFIDWTARKSGLTKRVAKYNQFWGVNAAVRQVIDASRPDGNRHGGVVWHTQGSGKSFEMLLTVNKLMRAPAMANPTIVILTDRNDLDFQLFNEEFAPSRLLPEAPRQAASEENLRELLDVASGGIVFAKVQLFRGTHWGGSPVMTKRRNVVVVVDEAHRTQYGLLEGFAANLRGALPNATLVAFTGTPLELSDRDTRQVFGDYISTYTPEQSIDDGATVPVFYESRLIKVGFDDDDLEALDQTFEEITEGVAEDEQRRLSTRWSRIDAILGADARLDTLVDDLLAHWEERRDALLGKAMLVVSSRRIAAELYARITAKRPDWHSDDEKKGRIKAVYTGSAADAEKLRRHLRTSQQMDDLKVRASDPADELDLIIVCDLWLTGFNSPSLHTMYFDKLMKGHGLFQAITRVNRPFRDKPAGVIVDYVGIADRLRESVSQYAVGQKPVAAIPIERAVEYVREKHDVVSATLAGHRWSSDPAGSKGQQFEQMHRTANHVVADPDRKERFVKQVLLLTTAYTTCATRPEVTALRNDIRFFANVRGAVLSVQGPGSAVGQGREALDTAIGQLVSSAIVADEVVDVFAMAGLDKPDVSILSDAFLDKLRSSDKPNLSLELLKKLLNERIREVQRTNVVQFRVFSGRLGEAIRAYQNRALTVAEVINELVELAMSLRAEQLRQEQSGLTQEELAFYDALAQNEAAVLEMGDQALIEIVHEVTELMRRDASVDWRYRANVRAALRVRIKRLLRRRDYPPAEQEKAVSLVIEQAELFADRLAA
jgi:type I restriction enzyme R subunit